MIQIILPFLTAIALSVVAAYYSVVGLAQIFPGSFLPVVIMGTTLEISKLVTVSWLYNNWSVTVRIMRYYFLVSIFLLMGITSMGIFGYLSRAHIETNIEVGSNSVQLQTLNQQEKIVNERLEYLMQRAGDPATASKKIDRSIQEAQVELKSISEQKLPLLKTENKLMAEVGPIRYIAELLYEKNDPTFIDKAVRFVIMIIIFVFDPLAILLLIASNQTYQRYKESKEEPVPEKKTPVKKKKQEYIPTQTLEPLFQDNDVEVIPKREIANFKGDSF
jgi:hypothetical protein